MKKNNVIINNNLKKDLEKYILTVTKNSAFKVREDLINSTFDAICRFYTDWTPKYYNRNYYNFLEKSFKGYYNNPHNQIIRGGVELTPYLMDDIYKSSSMKNENYQGYNLTDYIFNLVYSGYHGNIAMINPNFKVYRMNPSPLELILNKRDRIVNNINDYIEYGKKIAKGESYTTLLF